MKKVVKKMKGSFKALSIISLTLLVALVVAMAVSAVASSSSPLLTKSTKYYEFTYGLQVGHNYYSDLFSSIQYMWPYLDNDTGGSNWGWNVGYVNSTYGDPHVTTIYYPPGGLGSTAGAGSWYAIWQNEGPYIFYGTLWGHVYWAWN